MTDADTGGSLFGQLFGFANSTSEKDKQKIRADLAKAEKERVKQERDEQRAWEAEKNRALAERVTIERAASYQTDMQSRALQLAQLAARGRETPDETSRMMAEQGLSRRDIEAAFAAQGLTPPRPEDITELRGPEGQLIGISARTPTPTRSDPLGTRSIPSRRELEPQLERLLDDAMAGGIINRAAVEAINSIWGGRGAPFNYDEEIGRPENLMDEDERAELRQVAAPFVPGKQFLVDNDAFLKLAFAVEPLLDELEYIESLVMGSLTVYPCHSGSTPSCFSQQVRGDFCQHQLSKIGLTLFNKLGLQSYQYPRKLHGQCNPCQDVAWMTWEQSGYLPNPSDGDEAGKLMLTTMIDENGSEVPIRIGAGELSENYIYGPKSFGMLKIRNTQSMSWDQTTQADPNVDEPSADEEEIPGQPTSKAMSRKIKTLVEAAREDPEAAAQALLDMKSSPQDVRFLTRQLVPEKKPEQRRITTTIRGEAARQFMRDVYKLDLNKEMGGPEGSAGSGVKWIGDLWRDDECAQGLLSPAGRQLISVWAEREEVNSPWWWVRFQEVAPDIPEWDDDDLENLPF